MFDFHQVRMTPKCDKCGKRVVVGSGNGLPDMLGFQMQDGSVINICNACIMKLGAMKTKAEKDKFFKDLGKE